MGNKAIDKDYLLRQLKNFDDVILEEKYQEKLDSETMEKIESLPFSIVDGKLCVTYYQEASV